MGLSFPHEYYEMGADMFRIFSFDAESLSSLSLYIDTPNHLSRAACLSGASLAHPRDGIIISLIYGIECENSSSFWKATRWTCGTGDC